MKATRLPYSRMSAPEQEVWGRFLSYAEGQSRSWDYEFELGAGSYGPDATPPETPEFYLRALRKRVDAISQDESSVIIAEVKEVAGMACLGQLLTYRQLYWEEKRPRSLITLWAVCGRVDYDVRELFRLYSVRVFEV